MKSNVCKLEKGSQDLAAIFHEAEKVANYNGLSHKQSLQLRLLCEEIDGMIPWIIEEFEGKLWIELEDGVCKVNISLELADLTMSQKETLIEIAKNKKNAEAVGIIGKIRSMVEDFFLAEEMMSDYPMPTQHFHLATGYSEGVDYAYLWSLDQYRSSVNKKEQAEKWDELEKSVIASVADDVIVGVKGKRVDIVVIKRFA